PFHPPTPPSSLFSSQSSRPPPHLHSFPTRRSSDLTIEHTIKGDEDIPCLRIGFRYVRGLRQTAVDKIVSERQKRPFEGIDDLVRRVPELQKPELVTLSEIGALNSLGRGVHRRTALWQVERAARPAGPLLDAIPEQMELSPLRQMTDEERLIADFHGL